MASILRGNSEDGRISKRLAGIFVAACCWIAICDSYAAEIEEGFHGGAFVFGGGPAYISNDASVSLSGPSVSQYHASYSATAFASASSPPVIGPGQVGNISEAIWGGRYGFGVRGSGLVVGKAHSTATASISGGSSSINYHSATASAGGPLLGLGYDDSVQAGVEEGGQVGAQSLSYTLAVNIESISVGTSVRARAAAGADLTHPASHSRAEASGQWSFTYIPQGQRPVVSPSSCPDFDTPDGGPVYILIHGWDPFPSNEEDWVQTAHNNIINQGGPAKAYSFDWSEGAMTGPFGAGRSLNNARNAGRQLGHAILDAMSDPDCMIDLSKLHIIAHSHGAAVADSAATILESAGKGPIGKATLIDMPQQLFGVFDPLLVADGMVRGFRADRFGHVTNLYVSGSATGVGAPLPSGSTNNVTNIKLDTTRLVPFGLPTHNAVPKLLAAIFAESSNSPLIQGIDSGGNFIEGLNGELHPNHSPLLPVEFRSLHQLVFDPSSTVVNAIHDTVITMIEGSPAVITTHTMIPEAADHIRFSYSIPQSGNGDSLSLHFNGELLFFTDAIQTPAGIFVDSGMINISHLAALEGELSFVLNSTGQSESVFSIKDLQYLQRVEVLAVPEPSTRWLLATMVFVAVPLRCRRMKWSL